ncbi:interferon alpha/beta receptor 1 [Hyperolius riggenbachi]|uniref:interferon alpha/beta receptor 1 n=1 Tax=Hyperolius riggenbachi TaxID=752182 RepID=UPI0035A2AE4C
MAGEPVRCTLLLLPLLAGLTMAGTGLSQHLRVEAIDASFLLKWDWDFQRNPNVTFSVDHCFPSSKKWMKMEGCENITTLECNVSGIDKYVTTEFRVSVYNSQTGERSFNFVEFHPRKETVPGPPTGINMTIHNNVLYILVEEPEGLHLDFLRGHIWKYELEIWKGLKKTEVITKDADGPHFRIEALETSTTYCARARVKRADPDQTGLYSKPFCITTAPGSYATELAIGLVFAGVIVMSGIVYVCLCPLKRYMKHVFFPKTKLPSSIEQCLQDSPRPCIKNPFLFHEEETTDKCYIIESSPAGNVTNAPEADGRDSGNYSNEDETGVARA